MADVEILVTQYHNGAVRLYITYDDRTLKVSSLRAVNNLAYPVNFTVSKPGQNPRTVNGSLAANSEQSYNIPGAYDVEVGIDPETGEASVTYGNSILIADAQVR